MKYTVIKKVTINAALETVFNNIADLRNWQTWSPWNCLDPESEITSNTDSMSWNGQFTGAGSMHITEQQNNIINIDLNFIKPFKSQAKVIFTLTKHSDKVTDVSWQMDSKLPFFMCFFKKLFEVMIGRDFNRGLTRLKYLCETNSVPSMLEFVDTANSINGFKIAGLKSSCHMSVIAENMHKSFTKLHVLTTQAKIQPTGMACFCDNVKLTKEIMNYTAAAIYDGSNIDLGELHSKQIPNHKAIKVIMYGSYDFMGDAWAGIYAHVRGLKLKVNKSVPPYEVYIKGPHNTDSENDYVTEIYFPVK